MARAKSRRSTSKRRPKRRRRGGLALSGLGVSPARHREFGLDRLILGEGELKNAEAYLRSGNCKAAFKSAVSARVHSVIAHEDLLQAKHPDRRDAKLLANTRSVLEKIRGRCVVNR